MQTNSTANYLVVNQNIAEWNVFTTCKPIKHKRHLVCHFSTQYSIIKITLVHDIY